MKFRRMLFAAGAVALATYGACHVFHSSDAAKGDPKLFLNRVWIEREPKKPTDEIHAMFAISRQSNGVFFKGSSFIGKFERFDFERSDEEVRLVFPQSGKKARFTYKISSCSEVDGFDLCLDISENPWGGPKRYYGATEQDSMPAASRAFAATLPH